MFLKNIEDLTPRLPQDRSKVVVWLLCHYPGTTEAKIRIEQAVALQKKFGLSLWLFGSSSARYPESVEKLMGRAAIAIGAEPSLVRYSSDFGVQVSLDTVQETHNVLSTANALGVTHIICVSNWLQLLQVYGFARTSPLSMLYWPTPLKEWRWWYVSGRLCLIPLAWAGVGRSFFPLRMVRHARDHWALWPF